jgi:IBR domain, a half RING-finger domain/Zinc finger, C3HC4 type (RING finger)
MWSVVYSDIETASQCSVCYEAAYDLFLLSCGHLFCAECMRNMLRAALDDSSLLPILCCDVKVDTSISRQLLHPSEVDLLITKTDEKASKRKMYCPACSCFLNLELVDNTYSKLYLCGCGSRICTACRELAHPQSFCRKVEFSGPKDLFDLIQDNGWKQCPECSVIIERISGCDHMTCKLCTQQFCFKCMAPWRSDHDSNVCEELE